MSEEERPTSCFYEEEDGSGVRAFMCLTDFEYEVGAAAGGNRVYPSLDDALRSAPCTTGCGVVEVRIVGHAIVRPASPLEDKLEQAERDPDGT